MKLLKGTLFLKLLSFAAAVLTYFFIHSEMVRMKEPQQSFDQSYKLLKPTAKTIPVKVRLATEPPEGYVIDEENVVATPSHIVVIGPEALLDDASNAETALVDVSENTRSVTKRIPVESVAGTHLSGEPYYVAVTVPIRKVEAEKTEEQKATA